MAFLKTSIFCTRVARTVLQTSVKPKLWTNQRTLSRWTSMFSLDLGEPSSSSWHSTSTPPEQQIHPYALIEDDLKTIQSDIREQLTQGTHRTGMKQISTYYFDGKGKAFRPMMVLLMSRAVNHHMGKDELLEKQRVVAMLSEMVHTASLYHDDAIDQPDQRRGKPSVNNLWNPVQVAAAGNYITSINSMMVGQLKNDDVTTILAQVLNDLVKGEMIQSDFVKPTNDLFVQYLFKTFNKSASLIANYLKAVAILAEATPEVVEMSYQYGRNVGMAFQIVDDLLDFVSSADEMGKPVAADVKLGLATAPVLFASEKFPELHPMMMRRFQEPGDVERALQLVTESNGLEQTKSLAHKHCTEAVKLIDQLSDSPYKEGLKVVCDLVLNRMK